MNDDFLYTDCGDCTPRYMPQNHLRTASLLQPSVTTTLRPIKHVRRRGEKEKESVSFQGSYNSFALLTHPVTGGTRLASA